MASETERRGKIELSVTRSESIVISVEGQMDDPREGVRSDQQDPSPSATHAQGNAPPHSPCPSHLYSARRTK